MPTEDPEKMRAAMKRVAVTGLGAVTPIGNDVPSMWKAAVAGESGIDWIRSFDPAGLPVRVAAEVKGFDATQVASPKVLANAASHKITARSRRNTVLIGALIGLILGALAALLWEPVAARVTPRNGE